MDANLVINHNPNAIGVSNNMDNDDGDVYAAFEMPDVAGSGNPWSGNLLATNGLNPFGTMTNKPTSQIGQTPIVAGANAAFSRNGNPFSQQSPNSQWGSGAGMKTGSSWGYSVSRSGQGPMSAASSNALMTARPMTSNKAVGYSATGTLFDPTGQARMANMAIGPAPPLKTRGENSPEEQCMEMEKEVNKLVEESAMLALQKDYAGALEKAKDAGKKERQLCKQREQLGLGEQINADLTYAVHVNVAIQYQNHQLYTEALNTYNLIVRNKQYPQAGRLRVNMGNIYAAQKRYLLAIKMYRMTLDETSSTGKELRFKLLRNIGNAFVNMGQYRDAVNSYEAIIEAKNDVNAAFNLLLCYYALGETEKTKRTFQKLLSCRPSGIDDGDEFDEVEQKKDVLVDDALRTELKQRRSHFLRCIMTAARLIAPTLDKDWRVGFDYLIEQLRQYEMHDPSSHVAGELEMCKHLNYLKHKRYQDAISGLKAFEKKDKALRARAATNLAYLYFLDGDYENGEKYSDLSLESDPYNAKALVNKANFLFMKGKLDDAKEFYNKALSVEVDNIEALYNVGLTAKRLGLYEEAIKMFRRVQTIADDSEVIYQIADINDLVNNGNAIEWFTRLIGRVPTDPNALARMGSLFARDGDENQAFHYYLEAYRYYQVNMDVIAWLGAYFVKNEVYDKAIEFFDRASQIAPHEVKWQLMVASCYRRRGDYGKAKRSYEQIHRRYPENLECLKYLIQLCKDANLVEEANEWMKQMKKVENKLTSSNSDDDNDGYDDNNGNYAVNDNKNNNDSSNNNAQENDVDQFKVSGGNARKGRERQRQQRHNQNKASTMQGDALDDFKNTIGATAANQGKENMSMESDERLNNARANGKDNNNKYDLADKSSGKDRNGAHLLNAHTEDSDEDIDLPGM